MSSTTLHDYNDVESLVVREIQKIHTTEALVGWAGPSNREKNVAVCHRHRHPYGDNEEHQDFFRKCGGYTFDSHALNAMKHMGVNRIAIVEVDNGRVLEYDLNQFENSNLNSNTVGALQSRSSEGNVNYCVAVEEALYIWNKDECNIMQNHN